MPIIDMMIKSYNEYSRDYKKIIKDQNFEDSSTRNFPDESEHLHEQINSKIEHKKQLLKK